MKSFDSKELQAKLDAALQSAIQNTSGQQADYIPELAEVDPNITGVVVQLIDGRTFGCGHIEEKFTLQSASKLIVLAGLLEECGIEAVLQWVNAEPSGTKFSSVARLDQFGPKPANPCLNSGAISLCSHIPGGKVEKIAWSEKWTKLLFGGELHLNPTVLASEKQTGHRNRAIAYILKSNNFLPGDVEETLDIYFAMCSYKANLIQCSYFARLLAAGGVTTDNQRVLSCETVEFMLSVMATCGLYNESGIHLVRTGLPAKSGVSGIILCASPSIAGISVFNPRLSENGNSIRGSIMLESISKSLGLHFAKPYEEPHYNKK